MLWVSHGVSEQNSRRAAHMAQPGSLPPRPSAHCANGNPALPDHAGQSWWAQLWTPLWLTHCCPVPHCCRAMVCQWPGSLRLLRKTIPLEVEGCSWSFLAPGVPPVGYGLCEQLLLAAGNTAQPGAEIPDSWNYYAKHNMKMLRALLSRQHSQAKSSVD